MHGLVCDRCDKNLLIEESVRYEVRIVVQAAYDPLEITREDLARDLGEEWRTLLAQLETLDPADAQDQIHKEMRFDLCPACQKEYLRRPLP